MSYIVALATAHNKGLCKSALAQEYRGILDQRGRVVPSSLVMLRITICHSPLWKATYAYSMAIWWGWGGTMTLPNWSLSGELLPEGKHLSSSS